MLFYFLQMFTTFDDLLPLVRFRISQSIAWRTCISTCVWSHDRTNPATLHYLQEHVNRFEYPTFEGIRTANNTTPTHTDPRRGGGGGRKGTGKPIKDWTESGKSMKS